MKKTVTTCFLIVAALSVCRARDADLTKTVQKQKFQSYVTQLKIAGVYKYKQCPGPSNAAMSDQQNQYLNTLL